MSSLYNQLNQLLDKLKSNWSFIKAISCQFIMLITCCFIVFWMVFGIVQILMIGIAPNNPIYSNYPNLHVKPTDSQFLMAIYTNEQAKKKICLQQDTSTMLQASINSLGLSHGQFCSFSHENLPQIKGYIDVRVQGLISSTNSYVSVCVQYGSQYLQPFACQKYLVTADILILKNVQLTKLSFFSLLIQTSASFEQKEIVSPIVYFEQQINFIVYYIKVYYYWISLMISLGTATFITLIVLISGIVKYWQQMQQTKYYFQKTK